MAYRVSLSAPAEADAYAAFERIREAAPIYSEAWLTRLFEAILSLDEIPARCPVVPEAGQLGFPHLIFCMAREGVFTGLSSISGRRSSMYACCVSGTLPATP